MLHTKQIRPKMYQNGDVEIIGKIFLFFCNNLLTNRKKCSIIVRQCEKRLVGQAVKTSASHAENMGSIPVRVTRTTPPWRVVFFVLVTRTRNLTRRRTSLGSNLSLVLSGGELVRRGWFPYVLTQGHLKRGVFFILVTRTRNLTLWVLPLAFYFLLIELFVLSLLSSARLARYRKRYA